jgi:hypothetical protein
MKRSNTCPIYSILTLSLLAAGPLAAQEQFETLDPGPLPSAQRARPAPLDWRREAPPGDIVAQIAELSKRGTRSLTGRIRLQKLRAALKPPLAPPEAEVAMRQVHERWLAEQRRSGRGRRKKGHNGFSVQALDAARPDREFLQVKASPVYVQQWQFEAGHEYLIETRNVSSDSDPMLYVLHNGRQVAFNDDRADGDPACAVRLTPEESGAYLLIVRAKSEAWAGSCDLYIDGQVRQSGVQFGGSVVPWDWKAGDRFQTAHLPSTYARPVDTLLFAFDGDRLVGWNDDGGIRGCSALTLASDSTSVASHVLVGSASQERSDSDWVMLYRNALSGPDSDGDGLADSLEASLGTDPHAIDTDGDGLRDDWELFGIHTPAGDEDLPSYAGIGINNRQGSDPRVPDLFLEIDWMEGPKGQPFLFRPLDAAVDLVTRQFWLSGGIRLHIDLGQMGTRENRGGQPLPYQESFDRTGTEPLSLESCFASGDWFATSRRHLFAYIFCSSRFPDRVSSGHMVRFNEDGTINQVSFFNSPLCPAAIISMGTAINGSLQMEAGTLMHEFGHCLNLQHGGFESWNNFKPNYPSSMNYLFQFGGLDPAGAPDYSHGSLPDLDERWLDETVGVGPVNERVSWLIRRGRSQPVIPRREDVRSDLFPNAIDWDGDGRISATPAHVDFNGDGWYVVLRDNDDWAEVRRPLGGLRWIGLNAGVSGWLSASDRA